MEDRDIVDLYLKRDERAVGETAAKYSRYLYSIANGVLHSHEDSEECVNDTYLGAWGAIPPHRPDVLKTFLGKITRRISLKRRREMTAAKRGGGAVEETLEELAECIPSPADVESELEEKELADIIDAFLAGLSDTERRVFVCRYWYFDSVAGIAERFGFGESRVKMMLKRTRDKLMRELKREEMI